MSSIVVLIPARLGSTRFPNKPLVDIKGKPMILHVCDRAKEAGFSNVIVACSEEEVKKIVEDAGFEAIMTDPELPSGTDRINQALSKLEGERPEIIVNLQGDLPNIDPSIISDTVKVLQDNKEADIATAVVQIREGGQENDPNIVKAVVNFEDSKSSECLYFSRSKVPYNAKVFYEHIGIYVYRRKALEKFVELPESYFEKCEKLEQLRAIENGLKIFACQIDYNLKPVSVDVKEDLNLL